MGLYEDIKKENPEAKDSDIRDYVLQEASQAMGDIKNENPDALDSDIFDYIAKTSGVPLSVINPDSEEGMNKSIEDSANNNVAKLEQLKIDNPDLVEVYDTKITKQKIQKQEQLDKVQKDKLARMKISEGMANMDRTITPTNNDQVNKDLGDAPLDYATIDPIMGAVGGVSGLVSEGVATLAGEAALVATEKIPEDIRNTEITKGYTVGQAIDLAATVAAGGYAGSQAKKATDKVSNDTSIKGSNTMESEVYNPDRIYTNGAEAIKNQMNLSKEVFEKALEGVPRSQQTKVLAEKFNIKGRGFIKDATRNNPQRANKQIDNMTARTEAVESALKKNDIEEIDKNTKELYSSMKEMTKDSNVVIDGKEFLGDLEGIMKYGAVDDNVMRKVDAMNNTLKDNPNMSFETVIDFRETLNKNIDNNNISVEGRKIFKSMKDKLDKSIKTNAPKESKKFVDDAVDAYRRTAQHKEVLDVLKKHTVSEGDGVGRSAAMNYTKAKEDLISRNIDSPESIQALEILKSASKRFGDESVLFKEASVNSSDGFKFFSMVGTSMGMIGNIITEKGRNINSISRSIKRDIDNSSNPIDFSVRSLKNPNTPKKLKKLLAKNVKNIKATNAKQKLQKKQVEELSKKEVPNDTKKSTKREANKKRMEEAKERNKK